ncbi:hypothetical protein HMPREF1142_2004 [Peptostreptococcaceae bacterium AS15]|nr:hypothetical protein HMPREF1142_2004 [Peptostreptococcaceae bacterium AS15]
MKIEGFTIGTILYIIYAIVPDILHDAVRIPIRINIIKTFLDFDIPLIINITVFLKLLPIIIEYIKNKNIPKVIANKTSIFNTIQIIRDIKNNIKIILDIM